MASSDIYIANETFATELDGQSIIVQKDVTRVRAGHPLLKGKKDLFTLLTVQFDVEQATAKPGEQRGAPATAPATAPAPEAKVEKAPEVKAEKDTKAEADKEIK